MPAICVAVSRGDTASAELARQLREQSVLPRAYCTPWKNEQQCLLRRGALRLAPLTGREAYWRRQQGSHRRHLPRPRRSFGA